MKKKYAKNTSKALTLNDFVVVLFEKTVKIDKNSETPNSDTTDIKSIENCGMYASVVILHFFVRDISYV